MRFFEWIDWSDGRIRLADLEAAVKVAVDVLSKKADLIKVEERYRSCHIPPPDGTAPITATQNANHDLSSSLLDAEEDADDPMAALDEPSRTATSSSSPTKKVSLSDVASPLKSSGSKTAAVEEEEAGVAPRAKPPSRMQRLMEAKRTPRDFLLYQCWCCRFFTTNAEDFIKHVSGKQIFHVIFLYDIFVFF